MKKFSNHMLLRVLPSVYPRQPDTIHGHLGNLTAMMTQLESPEQQHLIRLIQIVAEQHPLMLSPQVPALVSFLGDQSLTECLLGALVDVSQASPSSLVSFLPTLRILGQQCPALLGHVAKIHGAAHAHGSLVYLVSCLGSMDHSFHHTLLLEIRALTDRYPYLLGGCGKDIYRMSNSFTAIARLLGRRLEESTATHCRLDEMSPFASLAGGGRGSEQRLQLKIQRRYSLSQAVREERREMRFNRSKSLALHAVRSRSITSDTGEDAEGLEPSADCIFSQTNVNSLLENQEAPPAESKLREDSSTLIPDVKEAENCQSNEKNKENEEEETDRLFIHLRDNMEAISEFCRDILQQIPIPEQCVIEDSNRGCVAKLAFSCPLKGHYCLYAKSCFNMTSRQPHLWIHIMLLHLQSKSSVALCSRDECVQKLASLWEKTQLKGAHSFPKAMTQQTTPHRKDLDGLQVQLDECGAAWGMIFSQNSGVVNQEGQPLIEGKLKEKQVRWKFIKRWKTRYFTLAGNQLLFRRGKSKDELDDTPIELSKVQSVKVVAKKRRDRGLPRAFEIFTDSKTYVLKAHDEKHAEEWLQCINVAVAQARERENREATTYL
ncbi:hypothetical protein JOQ06_016865 [Pogonophryne albipinna]|uniref:PH domain-containing protein n=1 Tax=Pogonophryne albipinna TaxID=1090488 RepID=A0AAD6FJ47_9TELE|nr:hypothetical protein JOQ06_016865 [Pogonophryne albipinna]